MSKKSLLLLSILSMLTTSISAGSTTEDFSWTRALKSGFCIMLLLQAGSSSAQHIGVGHLIHGGPIPSNPYDRDLDRLHLGTVQSFAKVLEDENNILLKQRGNDKFNFSGHIHTAYNRMKDTNSCPSDEIQRSKKGYKTRVCDALILWKNEALKCLQWISGTRGHEIEWPSKYIPSNTKSVSVGIPTCPKEDREDL